MSPRDFLFLSLFLSCITLPAFAEEGPFWPSCSLEVRSPAGRQLAQAPLKISGLSYRDIKPGTINDQVVHQGKLGPLEATVEHFIGITSLTMVLKSGQEELLVALARVPTPNNPQSFVKAKLEGGNWAVIECETQEYSW